MNFPFTVCCLISQGNKVSLSNGTDTAWVKWYPGYPSTVASATKLYFTIQTDPNDVNTGFSPSLYPTWKCSNYLHIHQMPDLYYVFNDFRVYLTIKLS